MVIIAFGRGVWVTCKEWRSSRSFEMKKILLLSVLCFFFVFPSPTSKPEQFCLPSSSKQVTMHTRGWHCIPTGKTLWISNVFEFGNNTSRLGLLPWTNQKNYTLIIIEILSVLMYFQHSLIIYSLSILFNAMIS